MASIKPATRYANPAESDASSSSEFVPAADLSTMSNYSKINLGFMVKKFADSKKANGNAKFVVAANILAEDLKEAARKGAGLGGLHKKFFNSKKEESSKKALMEVRANTRTLGMVLRSERELLSKNKELEQQNAELKLQLEEKSREIEKLKDLCLKQRGEIKSLKSAVQFPDVMNLPLQEMVEKQGSELELAKELIPSLQRQVTSLTGQLRCLAEDLAEVKAEKCSGRGLNENWKAMSHDQEVGIDSPAREFSEDDVFVQDLNPCLTPYTTKSQQFADGCDSPW